MTTVVAEPNFFARLVFVCVYALLSLSLCVAPPARADSSGRDIAKFASGPGNILFLAAAVGLPLVRDGKNADRHALRAADGIGSATLVSYGLKLLTREKRPDSNNHDSFPSGHATAAFAAATMESSFHPGESLYWYAGATAISLSRVRLNVHHPQDIIAGAALGYAMGRLELSSRRGLILQPFIQPYEKSVGLNLTAPLR